MDIIFKVLNRIYLKRLKVASQNCFSYCYFFAFFILDKENNIEILFSTAEKALKFIEQELEEEEQETLDFTTYSLVSWLKSDGKIYSLIACKERASLRYFIFNTKGISSAFSYRTSLKKLVKSKSAAKKKDCEKQIYESEKKTKAKIGKLISQHRKSRIREETIKRYGGIELPKLSLALITTVFTSLILASSFYFNTQLFSALNLPLEGVLTPSDYIYSSLTFIFPLILSFLISTAIILWMLKDVITKEISKEKFGVTYKNEDRELNRIAAIIIIANITSFVFIFIDANRAQSMLDHLLPINSLIVLIFLLQKAPLDLFEKPRRVYTAILTLIFFGYSAYHKTETEVNSVKEGTVKTRFIAKTKTNPIYYDLIKTTEKFAIVKEKEQPYMLVPISKIVEIKERQ